MQDDYEYSDGLSDQLSKENRNKRIILTWVVISTILIAVAVSFFLSYTIGKKIIEVRKPVKNAFFNELNRLDRIEQKLDIIYDRLEKLDVGN